MKGETEGFGEVRIELGAFSEGGGEKEAAEEGRLLGPGASLKDDIKIEFQPRSEVSEDAREVECGIHFVRTS